MTPLTWWDIWGYSLVKCCQRYDYLGECTAEPSPWIDCLGECHEPEGGQSCRG